MYVVMTTAEIFQYASRYGNSGIEENLGWDAQDLETESTGISQSELAAFEICVPEYRARRMGILAPRGEYWISRTVERDAVGERMPIPWAMCPDRPLPSKGEPVQ